jgi:hypothetical protein
MRRTALLEEEEDGKDTEIGFPHPSPFALAHLLIILELHLTLLNSFQK